MIPPGGCARARRHACGAAVALIGLMVAPSVALACIRDADCFSGVCVEPVCLPPSCDDLRRDGAETDVDCGGPACGPCPVYGDCIVDSDCVSDVCLGGVCQPTACHPGDPCRDDVQNGTETDVDCGGVSCERCGVGRGCTAPSDCGSRVCTSGTCRAATCTDRTQNGTETDVDCGGLCGGCPLGRRCSSHADCASDVCASNGTCRTPECWDGMRNGGETGVDCGGLCAPCGSLSCGAPGDCPSGVCSGGTCLDATCSDGVQNGVESDLDCGGYECPRCSGGARCQLDADCGSHVCRGGRCRPSVCTPQVACSSICGAPCPAPVPGPVSCDAGVVDAGARDADRADAAPGDATARDAMATPSDGAPLADVERVDASAADASGAASDVGGGLPGDAASAGEDSRGVSSEAGARDGRVTPPPLGDAGSRSTGSGGTPVLDARVDGAGGSDAGISSPTPPRLTPRGGPSAHGVASSSGGCGCRTHAPVRHDLGPTFVLWMLAWVARRKRRG